MVSPLSPQKKFQLVREVETETEKLDFSPYPPSTPSHKKYQTKKQPIEAKATSSMPVALKIRERKSFPQKHNPANP